MIERVRDVGAVQIQLGKLYPYRSSLGGVAWQILEAVKNHVDPARLMNPGALGLD